MIPRQRPSQSFNEHQREVAQWAGYGDDVAALNRDHDPLHRSLCNWLGVPCLGLPGSPLLSERGEQLAAIEEDAVLHVQRLIAHHGAGVPG